MRLNGDCINSRRLTITETQIWNGEKFHIAASIDPDDHTRICEVWAYGPKVGSALDVSLQEFCWHSSKQLQETPLTLQDLTKCHMRDDRGEALSVMGRVIDFALRTQEELRSIFAKKEET